MNRTETQDFFTLNAGKLDAILLHLFKACEKREQGLMPIDMACLIDCEKKDLSGKIDALMRFMGRGEVTKRAVQDWIEKNKNVKSERDVRRDLLIHEICRHASVNERQLMNVLSHPSIHELIDIINKDRLNIGGVVGAIEKLADDIGDVHLSVKEVAARQ